jgi:hypothetical protein
MEIELAVGTVNNIMSTNHTINRYALLSINTSPAPAGRFHLVVIKLIDNASILHNIYTCWD